MSEKIINHLNALKDDDLRLIYVTEKSTDETWHSTLHSHPFAEIFYVVAGKGQIKFKNSIISIKTDDIVIINQNVYHTEVSDKEIPLSYIVIGFSGASIIKGIKKETENDNEEIDDFLLSNYVLHKNLSPFRERILGIIKYLKKEHTDNEDYKEEIASSLLKTLLLYIIRFSESKSMLESESSNRQCEYIKQYFDTHYSKDIKLDEVAKMININKYQLIREFKKAFGITPIDYLLEHRISVSANLLKNTNHTIEEISRFVGFNTPSYFTQQFKKKMDMSPKEYRQKNR